MTMRILPLLLASLLLPAGCGLIEGDRLNVQQGNRLDAAEIAAVETGMTRSRVAELLGTPVLKHPFHPERWDYVYYVTEAGSGLRETPRRLTVHFSGDVVSRIETRDTGTDDG